MSLPHPLPSPRTEHTVWPKQQDEANAAVSDGQSEPQEDAAEAELFAQQQIGEFTGRWESLQVTFVDDPQRAVLEADQLVAEVIRELASVFAAHKEELEGQWRRDGEVATEDLRLAFRRYRSFFRQLLRT